MYKICTRYVKKNIYIYYLIIYMINNKNLAVCYCYLLKII